MLLYLIWATKPMVSDANFQQHQAYDSPEAVKACMKNLACFAERWDDAVSYFKIFEFLHHKITSNTSTSVLDIDVPSLIDAEFHLEQLKRRYLYRAMLGMIEDMMYGGSVRNETTLDNFVIGVM